MEESPKPELRQVVTGNRGLRLLYTHNERGLHPVHVVSHDTSPYLAPGDWCWAKLRREAQKCLIYDCHSLPERLMVFVGVAPSARRITTIEWHGERLIARDDLSPVLQSYFELSTDYRWPVIVGVHLVYEGAETLVFDLISQNLLPQN